MNLLTVTNLSAGYAGKQVIKDISFFRRPKNDRWNPRCKWVR